MTRHSSEADLSGVAALEEPVRRTLYFHVASQHREVSRDEAARAAGVSRALAGFHLDRLADEGLLEVSYRRVSGRSGPGAGRPAKLYRRSARQVQISLPPRSYEVAAKLLASAVDAADSGVVHDALRRSAHSLGVATAAEARSSAGKGAGRRRLVGNTLKALEAGGYEPVIEDGEIRLRNCPFHGLVGEHKELVCGMNLALVEGVIAGAALPGAEARLDPRPGTCCVAISLHRP